MASSVTKESNPKDRVGIRKAPTSTVPTSVTYAIGLGLLEGARKYGRHNYRVVGVLGSVYTDAAKRHIDAWWEGENLDPDSGLSHIAKAMSSLAVLYDAMVNDKLVDDRPPPLPAGWLESMNRKAAEIIDKYPDPVPPYTAAIKEEN